MLPVSVHAQVLVQKPNPAEWPKKARGLTHLHRFIGFTFRNICSFSPLTKENSFKHKSWNGLDRFLHPSLSLIAGPEGVGNVLSCVYHSQAELGVAGLTAWSCGGDIRRFGRGPQRGDLAFVLQTQSHARYLFIYIFAARGQLAPNSVVGTRHTHWERRCWGPAHLCIPRKKKPMARCRGGLAV